MKERNGQFIWVTFEDYNPARASQKAPRTVLPIRSQGTVMQVSWDRKLYLKWHMIDTLHDLDLSLILMGHVTPYKIQKQRYLLSSCFADARRM